MDRCDRVAPGCYVPDLIEDCVVRCLDGCAEGENPGDDDVHTSSAWVDGGHRIRTCKGLRPPVFKTGALAIRPALPAISNLPPYRAGCAYQSHLADLCTSGYLRGPVRTKTGPADVDFRRSLSTH